VSTYQFAEVWETVAGRLPSAPALLHGDETVDWATFDRRADSLAAWLLEHGATQDGTFAQYLYSSPAYLECVYACWKLGIAPVNTNYRYGAEELVYLWDNADTTTVAFHGVFADTVEPIVGRLPGVGRWLWVDDGTGPCPDWASPFGEATGASPARVVPPWGRSPDDLFLIYTGGTTGLPKGVMWRQDDLFGAVNRSAPVRYPDDGSPADVAPLLLRPGPSLVAAAPLMHGTGLFSSFGTLSSGGAVITLPERRFSAESLLDAVVRHRAKGIALVGDAFARPVLAALDAEPDRWDVSSLRIIMSSGVMWSTEVKEGLLRHNPELILVDSLGSSEGLGTARAVSGNSPEATKGPTGRFAFGPYTQVFTEDGQRVEPGSGERGLLAQRGRIPLGYYKDPEKSARTFPVIDGERWSVPGDYATVEADGTIVLLGRGSACINTGGEKVFPEEVEEALKTHPDVDDAVCVGLPDERFGERVVAVVAPVTGAHPDPGELIDHVKGRLAHYKAPRQVLLVPALGRAANGKADYRTLKDLAQRELGPPAS